MAAKSSSNIVCVLLLLCQSVSLRASAQEAGHTDLDLSSTNRTITAGDDHSGTITVGGSSVNVTPGYMLTPAESVALSQVLGGGAQNLVLDAAGAAIGGNFTITGSGFANLVIPTGVTAVHDFGTSGGLNLSGNLNNSGSFFAVSSNNQITNAIINAQNISNYQSGLITSILPEGGFAGLGYTNLLSNLSLTLNAVQNITNYGVISSAGNLNLSAGGSVSNLAGSVMSAVQTLNIQTTSLINSGAIAAQNNINIVGQLHQSLLINNVGGNISALNEINVANADLLDSLDLSISGGDWLSTVLHVNAGAGDLSINADTISGSLTVQGNNINVFTSGDTLRLVNVNAGDPAFINNNGDIIIDTSMQFSGQDLAIVASGSIYSSGGPVTLDTSSASAKGGSITLVAGGLIGTLDNPESVSSIAPFNGPITVSGGNGNPAFINLDGSLNASGSTGGNINLVSFGGGITVSGSLTSTGGGNVTVVGNGPINIGSVDTSGGTFNNGNVHANGNGNVQILAAAPTTNAPLQDGSGGHSTTVVINNGTITGGFSDQIVSGGFLLSPSQGANAAINVGDISSTGGMVLVRGGGEIQTGNVLAASSGSFNTVQIGNLYNSNFVASGNVSTGNVSGYSINVESAHELHTGQLNGIGGIVSASANSDNTFTVGGGSGANIASISNIGVSFGLGMISVFNKGTGDLVINQALDSSTMNIFALSPGTPAPQISITANGNISLPGSISVGTGGMGDGGGINIQGKNLSFQGAADLQANATGDGNGGTILIRADNILAGSGLSMSANGSGFGFGGNILVGGQSGTASNIDGSGSLQASANGGQWGNGGGIDIYSSVNPAMQITASANGGSDAGNGGYINIDSSTSTSDLIIAGAGSISAGGFAEGASGGYIWIWSGGNLDIGANAITNSAGLDGNGGFIDLRAGESGSGTLALSGDLHADGNGSGNGGSVTIWAPSIVSSGSTISANGGSSGNGGSILLRAESASANINGSDFILSATGGAPGGSGNGGSIEVNAGGNIDASSNFNVSALGGSGDGGSLTLVAGFADLVGNTYQLNGTGSLNLSAGVYDVSGSGSGSAGSINFIAAQMGAAQQVSLRADGGSSGGSAGSINISSAENVIFEGSSLSARGSSSAGGNISVLAGADLHLSSTSVDASSTAAAGGKISLSAGAGSNGNLILDGNILADGAGSEAGGSISLSQNSNLAMQLGQSSSGLISASNLNGQAGSLSISSSGANDLNVVLNQSIRLEGAGSELGDLQISAAGAFDLSGPGSVRGELSGSAASVSFASAGAGSIIGVESLSASAGDLSIRATAPDSLLVFASGSSLSSAGGNIELAAPAMEFLGNSTLAMDNAGLLRIHSGDTASSLSINLADGATLSFNLEQGTSARPGLVEIGPTGTGGLSINSAGSAQIDFDAATASLSSLNGSIDLGSGVSLNSDALDGVQNLGIEIISANGDINLNSNITARQLDITSSGGGNVNLGADLVAPTVSISVDGNSTINQTGNGSVGIGTLVLNSANGDIGSALNPIEANVLELQVNSGASAFINNASSLDLRSSNLAGSLQLTNDGDLAILSNVSAGNLSISANGSISINSNTSGSGSVVLAVNGTGENLSVASGALLSSGTALTIGTDNLLLDGSISAGSQLSLNSNGNLSLSGTSGSITAGNLISISGSDSVDFASSYTLNAGASGTVQIQTGSLSSGGVSLSNGADLSAAGGSQLNIFTNALSISSGSSITGSNATNAVTVQSTAGAPLAVSLSGLSADINSSAGGAVSFTAGVGGGLSFSRAGGSSGASADLNINGGDLRTESTSADTTLASVNLNSDRNITITVNGASLNLNGDINSSLNGGVIVLQDPDSITINGNGSVGFAPGASGSIFVQALSQDAELRFAGNPTFHAGSNGSVAFSAAGLISFESGANVGILDGAAFSMNAPTIAFASGSALAASGASEINIGGYNSGSVSFILPDNGSASISTNGGAQIAITGSGTAINFMHNDSGSSSATLNLLGAPVLIQTSNADVTIDSNVVVRTDHDVSVLTPGGTFVNNGELQTPTEGSTTIIEASGPLFIDKNVSADSLIVRTIANNGTITLGADLNVTNDLTVSAHGSGDIYQTAGLLSANSISLSSESGNIGSADGRIQVNASSLNVSTAGSAYVNSQGGIRVESYNVGGGLNLTAGGDIAIGAQNAASVNINSSGTFNAGTGGNVSVTATNAINVGAGVSLRVNKSALQMSAPDLNLGEGAKISSASDLSVNGDINGSSFKLASRQGDLSLNGDISGGNFKLVAGNDLSINGNLSGHNIKIRSKTGDIDLGGTVSANKLQVETLNNGNINFGDNVSATNKLTVSANGSGDITQSGGLLSSSVIELKSGSGDIGASSNALDLSADSLSVETGKKGLVNINAIGDLTLEDSSSGSNFTLVSSGNLTVNDVSTVRGSIYLSGHGHLQVEENARIQANQGNLTLMNTDSKSGTISIGKNSDLIALSNSQSNGLGNVYITIGALPKNPKQGKDPKGLKVSEKWGGHAYFGNGITVEGKNNQVNAWGSNVVFNTGSRPASAITLEGGVYILADPPPDAPLSAPAASTALVAAAAAAPSAMLSLPNTAQPAILNALPSGVLNKAALDSQSRKQEKAENAQTVSDLKAIACVTALTGQTVRTANREMQRLKDASGIVIAQGDSYQNRQFDKGEMILSAKRPTQIKSGDSIIDIKAGACVVLKSNGKGLEVFNVCESRWGSVKVSIHGKEFLVGAGQKLLHGQESRVAVRNEKTHRAHDRAVRVGEFPLMSLMANSSLLPELMHSPLKEDKQLAARLFKMAACLSLVTRNHGAFRED